MKLILLVAVLFLVFMGYGFYQAVTNPSHCPPGQHYEMTGAKIWTCVK